MTTNVPQPTFGARGFVSPSGPAVLAGVQADINAAFGNTLNYNLTTPQGQLASTMSAIIVNNNAIFVYYTNQVDPAYATGRMQDAIARIYFIERLPALPTVVQAVCSGGTGVVIPEGAQAQATDGNIYVCTQAGTIPAGGSITLPFSCVTAGPITCPAGALSKIFQVIPGWDSIDNPTDGAIGRNTESRAAFEARRAASVAKNSIGSLNAILGNVLAVPGVLDAYVTENTTGSPLVVGNVTLAPKSLYVAAIGGDSLAIATAIWQRKAPGAAYNGNTTIVVTDNDPRYSPPAPTYSVSFQIPTSLPILFEVDIVNGPLVPSDAQDQIRAAIVSAFAGGDGGTRARIGASVLASRYYGPVLALGSWVQIKSIKVGSQNAPAASFTASIAAGTMTVSAITTGALAVGQTVFGNNVAASTVITALGSGTGGTGTYTVSIPQTVGSEAMKTAVAALDSVIVGIDQVPTIVSTNIKVVAS